MYKSHKGPVSELHIVDQYMMEVQFTSAQHGVARPNTPGGGQALVRRRIRNI